MTLDDTNKSRTGKLHVQCKNFETALSFYTTGLGFRIDMIFPADAPRTALLSEYGLTMSGSW